VMPRYRMRQKLIPIGDDYCIEDEEGQRAFRVDGKALRLRKTFVLEEASGEKVAKSQERKLRVRDRMEIERPRGASATVRKALVAVRERGHRSGRGRWARAGDRGLHRDDVASR
jgi:uncharacterized protein YxjI